ncbi:PREDICTED: uncharacterized protein LOC109151156 [Ipomoea nil]|uniref:uncharacterized protein LOC109151156 n=1 Tax=Ipomoea nil TaxID=35883 RepID=UPI000901CF98|nr:PREDICTED: uncharacterized protein LOC109151156 [Ipomoea nil]
MGDDSALIDTLLRRLNSTFKIRDLGAPSFFLGIETIPIDGGLLLSQRHYMGDLLKRAGITDCKPLATPFMHAPTNDNLALLKRVLRYVKGTIDHGLRLAASSSDDIHAYSDSD